MDDQPPPPPPPPPPHGEKPKTTRSGLPDGNYDIFIIPPHSAGSGFLYLPSLQPQRNSFLAGVACTLLAYGLWIAVVPALKQWMIMIAASGGAGVALLVVGVGVVAWAFGKTQGENTHGGNAHPPGGGGPNTSSHNSQNYGAYSSQWTPPHSDAPRGTDSPPKHQPPPSPPPNSHQSTPQPPPPQDPPQSPNPGSSAKSAAWEKAKEETRKREEARKRAEDLRKLREEAARKKEEADKQARAAAEKLRWELNRQREKEQRERDAREKLAKEKAEQDKLQREKDKREQEVRERIQKQKLDFEKAAKEKAAAEAAAKTYERPTARSYASTDTASAYHRARNPADSSASSYTASSYAPTVSTARTSPPPEHRGPYKTSDPDKVVIKGVYMYNNMFPKPVSQLVSGEGSVTDGLVLRLTTEGLFIDDDVRDVPQREWDVKAWGIKSVETGEMKPFQIVRASVRDVEGKKYVFVVPSSEGWKVDAGVLRLKKGPLVRSLNTSTLKLAEMKKLLAELGFV